MTIVRGSRLALALAVGLLMVLLTVSIGETAQSQGAYAGSTTLHLPGSEASMAYKAPSVLAVSPLRSAEPDALLDVGVASLSGSLLSTENCYQPGETQVLCFTVYNGSSDVEWLDQVRLTFPALLGDWTVSCFAQDAADSSGSPVSFSCNAAGRQVTYTDNDGGSGEITHGSSWSFCVSVTIPSGYVGPRIINWGMWGDADPLNQEPPDLAGTLQIEQCTPLMLKPERLVLEGCNGITQTHTFELWNNTGTGGTFALSYGVPSSKGTFWGPSSFALEAGGRITFTVQLKPDRLAMVGEQMTATLTAEGNGELDSATIVNTVTAVSGWQARASSPAGTMDNVVVWASESDGGLWSIGGHGSGGATQRYDPDTDTWSTHTSEAMITPTIGYPMDGCYGLNVDGDEIVVLFPDTLVTGSLHIYNITDDSWYTDTIPVGGYPPEGRWGHDVVSLRNVTGVNRNVCYLSGGSTQEGGGRTRDLWSYYPITNAVVYLGAFPADIWFGFHASWYVPWVGDDGAICVGGGIDHNSQIVSATQCYDLNRGEFNAVNVDLGPLPEPWWGMADGWQIYNGQHQIWIANGVAQDGRLLPASAYAGATTGGFVSGPELPVGLYRLEGDGWDGRFYTLGGAEGGFSYSQHNLLLVPCPTCYRDYLPAVLNQSP
jgi:hypothetical protein